MTNSTKLYFNIALLLVFIFLFGNRLFTSIKTNNFDYLRLTLSIAAILLTVYQIVKLIKIKKNK